MRPFDGLPLRTGVHAPLEEEADRILRESLAKVTRHSDKSDILTPWKETARRSREVYMPSGSPDGSLRRGNFNRRWNSDAPHLNSVEGVSRIPRSRGHGANVWDSE